MKETTFESRAKEAFGDVYGKIKELETKAKQLRAELEWQIRRAERGPERQKWQAA